MPAAEKNYDVKE